MLDEALAIIAGLLGDGTFSFTGKHYQVEPVDFTPEPVQLPRVPIWVGGGYPNPGPTDRALRWDGSCMYGARTHDLSVDDVTDLDSEPVTAPSTSAWAAGSDARAPMNGWPLSLPQA